jgi:oligopeptide/dipeptide ABC transporter ATP-binding protein
VAVMYLGKIVESGPKEAFFENPLHPYSQALISAVPVPDPEMRDEGIILEGDVPSPISPPSGCYFRTRCPSAADICAREAPLFRKQASNQFVACHLV